VTVGETINDSSLMPKISPTETKRGETPGWLCHAARRVGFLPVAKFYRSMSAVAEGLVP
jgi:hypothetical protein